MAHGILRSVGLACAVLFMGSLTPTPSLAVPLAKSFQPPPPCHRNATAPQDIAAVKNRGDVKFLPEALRNRLIELAGRPHTYLPIQAYAEADTPSQLFQYYLLDTNGFQPNVFTARIPGVNDQAMLTATGADCGLLTVGAIRVVLEPKPGLPTDPNDPGAFIDMFTDIDPLFVINNESGWYEGWMIHDLVVPSVAPPRGDGHAQFGQLTQADANALARIGAHNNVPGNVFTTDGNAPHVPNAFDVWPTSQTNVVPVQLSLGAYNSMQQSDVHSYWEFNYQTNWVHPLYELPFTGGIPGTFGAGLIGALQSIVPGSGPNGVQNNPITYGDNPNTVGVLQASGPRDPDKFDADVDSQREFRERFIPSGLANEVFLDVFCRLASFEPGVSDFNTRLFDAYRDEVARVDQNADGVISAAEGDIDTATDGFEDNARLFIPATQYNRIAVSREINDGLLAPRFAPSTQAWVLSGTLVPVSPAVPASQGRDSDDR